MKTKLILIAAFLLPALAFAQTEDDYLKKTHQIGVNATQFIKEMLSFNNLQPTGAVPYILTYKYVFNNQAIRFGLGGSNSLSNSNPNNGTPLSTSRSMSASLRIGYEWRKNLSKHWLFYYGVDAVYNYSLNRFKSSTEQFGFPPQTFEVTRNIENYGAGGGGVLGFEFRLAKRVSFNVETQAYYMYTENRQQENNASFIGSHSNFYNAFSNFQIVLPTSLFFVVSL